MEVMISRRPIKNYPSPWRAPQWPWRALAIHCSTPRFLDRKTRRVTASDAIAVDGQARSGSAGEHPWVVCRLAKIRQGKRQWIYFRLLNRLIEQWLRTRGRSQSVNADIQRSNTVSTFSFCPKDRLDTVLYFSRACIARGTVEIL